MKIKIHTTSPTDSQYPPSKQDLEGLMTTQRIIFKPNNEQHTGQVINRICCFGQMSQGTQLYLLGSSHPHILTNTLTLAEP